MKKVEEVDPAALLSEKCLDNGLVVRLYDCSRQVAGDRWLVRVRCVVEMAVSETCFAGCQEEDQELLAMVRREIGDTLSLRLDKERHFVDQGERDEVGRQLVAQVHANMLGYLSRPGFPGRLFASRYQELRKLCLRRRLLAIHDQEPDDDGPADFSACFRD